MPNAEFAYITNPETTLSSRTMTQRPSTKSSEKTLAEDYYYDSEDEIAASKANQSELAPSPKRSALSKVKASLNMGTKQPKQPKQPKQRSPESQARRNQARADMLLTFEALAVRR